MMIRSLDDVCVCVTMCVIIIMWPIPEIIVKGGNISFLNCKRQ